MKKQTASSEFHEHLCLKDGKKTGNCVKDCKDVMKSDSLRENYLQII